jgi:ribosomal protein L32
MAKTRSTKSTLVSCKRCNHYVVRNTSCHRCNLYATIDGHKPIGRREKLSGGWLDVVESIGQAAAESGARRGKK